MLLEINKGPGAAAAFGGDGRAFDFGWGHDYKSFQTCEVEENLASCGCCGKDDSRSSRVWLSWGHCN
jgi:hypothetical protein